MRNPFLSAVVAGLMIIFASALHAQRAGDTRQFNDLSYEFASGDWWQIDPANGERFRVNRRIVTVKFTQDANRDAADALHASLGGTELRRAATGWADIRLSEGAELFGTLEDYVASDLVLAAEPTTTGRYALVPDDTEYGNQYATQITELETAWDTQTGDPSIIVAILDSGTEFTHDDLGTGNDAYQNVWLNSGEDAWSDPNDPSTGNGVDDDGNGFTDDWKGWDFDIGDNDPRGPFYHGTAVAGVTAAKTNNAEGIAGAAGGNNDPGISLMLAGVGGNAPNGAVLDDAILYAADNGANVVQMSLSVGTSMAIEDAVAVAYVNEGLFLVNAAGNGGQGCSIGFPGTIPNVMAVTASNSSDNAASFTCWGPESELAAPGASIRTTDLNNDYLFTSGTSFSAPLVSGIAALVWSEFPSLTNQELREVLWNSADKVGGFDYNWDAGNPGHSIEFGYGRINADAALQLAETIAIELFMDGFEDPPPPPP